MKSCIIIFITILFISSCSKEKSIVTKPGDYKSFLYNALPVANDPIREEIKFWNDRLEKNNEDEVSLSKLAGLHAGLFKATGLVENILLSDSLYNLVLKKYPAGSVDIYHCLSTNAISQHKFREANYYAEKALALKDKKAASLLILVDVSLELGDYAKANQIMRQFKNKNSFAYLIREGKIKDHEGKLDTAILYMEKAYERIKGNKALTQWTLSNLADMYGHANRLEQAYDTYLKVLKQNPHDDYTLKGIAWLAISHDHHTAEARTIVNTIASRKRMPEAHLMLAEIAELENNRTEKLNHLKQFKALVSIPEYKTMYHKYLALLEADEFNNPAACIEIANIEIDHRPTPESYDLLAWGYYQQKNFSKAWEIATKKVEHQTFEPLAYYHLGMIYLSKDSKNEARLYLSEALKSSFELGPSITNRIKASIQTL